MHIDTRSLINEVQKRPHLWNPSTREYRLREARMASWMDICGKLIKNFDGMDVRAQDKMVLKIRTRWKTARDTFMKINNNLKGRTKKASKYYFFEQLQFLRLVKQRKKPQYSLKSTADEEDPSPEETLKIKEEVRAETPEIKEEETTVFKIEDDSNYEMLAREQTPVPASHHRSKKQANEKEEEDADYAYLNSLLPTLRKFDDNQKLNFRVDVLQIIMRLRNSQKPSTSEPSSLL